MAVTKIYPWNYKLPVWAIQKSAELSSTAGNFTTLYFKRGIYVSFQAVGWGGRVLASSGVERFSNTLQRRVTLLTASYDITSVRILAQFYERGVVSRSSLSRVPYSYRENRKSVTVRCDGQLQVIALRVIAGARQ
jgi:hypothetical protein